MNKVKFKRGRYSKNKNKMELKSEDLKFLKEIYNWKKKSPEEYKDFLNQIKEILSDLIKVSEELSEEFKI